MSSSSIILFYLGTPNRLGLFTGNPRWDVMSVQNSAEERASRVSSCEDVTFLCSCSEHHSDTVAYLFWLLKDLSMSLLCVCLFCAVVPVLQRPD